MNLSARARRVGAASMLAAVGVAVPVGLAAAGGSDGPAGGTGPTTVTVRLTAHHSRFTPATVDVAAGTTVRFVIRNLDPIDHEFIIGGPDVHQHHEVGRDAHHHGEVPGEISIPAGTTASTTWTAPAGEKAQTAPAGMGTPLGEEAGVGAPAGEKAQTAPAGMGSTVFACHLPGHFAYGMAGVVRITG